VSRADIYNFVHGHAPSSVLVEAGLRIDGREPPSPLGPAAQLFTPETETTSHYFWLVSHNGPPDDPDYDEHVRAAGNLAFENEDQPMIEAVQLNMGQRDFDDLRPISFSTDGAAMLARRILARMIADETDACEARRAP
jgi:vanillate O-demethylase monooxygenase subunit